MDKQNFSDEIPMGFAMSLAQNSRAMRNYALMSDDERQNVNKRAANAGSKKEMRGIVSEIAEKAGFMPAFPCLYLLLRSRLTPRRRCCGLSL